MRSLGMVALAALVALLACAVPASAQTQLTWAGSLYAGYAKITEDGAPGGSVGFRGNVFAMVNPVIGVGAELGYHMLGSKSGSTLFVITDPVSGVPAVVPGTAKADWKALQATAQVIARGATGQARPFGVGGLGIYNMAVDISEARDAGGAPIPGDFDDTDTKFGFNLGGGIQFKPSASPVSFGVEARWHSVMNGRQVIDEGGRVKEAALDMVTVMAGIHFN